MKMKHAILLALIVPTLTFAASSSRQELARVFALTPDSDHGAQIFRACVSCHGADGNGVIAGTTPRIAGQHFRVLARQLVDFRHGKRWDFRMEGVAKSHEALPKPQDIADVSWYVSQLDRDGTSGLGNGDHVERGAKLFASKCASCHGARAEGDDAHEIPLLAGQHAAYLARQIYDAVDGRRPALTRSHRERFEGLTFEDVLGLSDYLSRVSWRDGTIR